MGPSKGYNLDFLDQLDDPNFNPFETKTAVVNNFDENQPITEASELSQENENIVKVIKEENKEEKTEEKTEDKKEKTKEDKKPKKALPPKPWLKKGPKKKAPEETPEAEKEEEIIVPSKGYNFDML